MSTTSPPRRLSRYPHKLANGLVLKQHAIGISATHAFPHHDAPDTQSQQTAAAPSSASIASAAALGRFPPDKARVIVDYVVYTISDDHDCSVPVDAQARSMSVAVAPINEQDHLNLMTTDRHNHAAEYDNIDEQQQQQQMQQQRQQQQHEQRNDMQVMSASNAPLVLGTGAPFRGLHAAIAALRVAQHDSFLVSPRYGMFDRAHPIFGRWLRVEVRLRSFTHQSRATEDGLIMKSVLRVGDEGARPNDGAICRCSWRWRKQQQIAQNGAFDVPSDDVWFQAPRRMLAVAHQASPSPATQAQSIESIASLSLDCNFKSSSLDTVSAADIATGSIDELNSCCSDASQIAIGQDVDTLWGLEEALKNMHTGEHSKFSIRGQYVWNVTQRRTLGVLTVDECIPLSVLCDERSVLEVEVKLHSFTKGAETWQLGDEEKLHYMQHWSKLAMQSEDHEDWARAIRKYLKVTAVFQYDKHLSDAQRQRVAEIKVQCHLALARCKSRLGDTALAEVFQHCNEALRLCPNHVPTLYRRAQAHISMHDDERASEDLNLVLQLQPTHIDAQREQQLLQARKKAHMSSERALFKHAFASCQTTV